MIVKQRNELLKNKIRKLTKKEIKKFENIDKDKLKVILSNGVKVQVFFDNIAERTIFLSELLDTLGD